MPSKLISMRIPEAELARWQKYCARERRTVTSLVLLAVEEYLKKSAKKGKQV